MTPKEMILEARSGGLTDEDGEDVEIELLPGLEEGELREFEAALPCPLPGEIRELLGFCRGFDGLLEQVDFTGKSHAFEEKTIFPQGIPLAADGFGNFWVADLWPDSTVFGPIWFACHDAPVILYQSADLGGFLAELFRMFRPPHESLVDDVHEDRIREVWRKNPGVLSREQCAVSEDALLREFAASLSPSFEIIDLRAAEPGDGFSWGRYGPKTVVKRHGRHRLFAYERRKGLIGRLFGTG